MANIHEITQNLIEFRGEVKAAQIKFDTETIVAHVGHSHKHLQNVIECLRHITRRKFTGTIWFESGSYAYLDKDGAGYYWNFIQVPEIPKELRSEPKVKAEKVSDSFYDLYFNGAFLGNAGKEIDGSFYFIPRTGGHNGVWSGFSLRWVADALDILNAPHDARLKAYFDSLPKEIDKDAQDEGLPF